MSAACIRCKRIGQGKNWHEALAAFYGPLMGRSGLFGAQVGERVRLEDSDPVGAYPLRDGLRPGDVVIILDFRVGCYTVRREADGLESEVNLINVDEDSRQ